MIATVYAYPASLSRDRSGRYVVRFPDLPEALTDGADKEEALAEAVDCLSEALMGRIADGEEIPAPSRPMRNQYEVTPDPTVVLKAALYSAARAKRVTAASLARQLRIDHKEARRLLDPRHPSKFPRLAAALDTLGYKVSIAVRHASRPARLPRTEGPSRRAMKTARMVKLRSPK